MNYFMILLYVYVAFYCIFSFFLIVSGIKHRDPLWKIAADAFLFLIGFTGILLYVFNVKMNSLVVAWRAVSLAFLIGQMAVNLYDRHQILSGRDATLKNQDISQRASTATDIITMIVVLPAVIINLLFAYF